MSPPETPRRQLTPLEPLLRRLESARVLDSPAGTVGRRVRGALAPGKFKDALSGTWLGHAVHPMLTDVVIGCFLGATLLDLRRPDDGAASERLIAIGIAAYGPTALTGISDWADSEAVDDGIRRVGLVHATSNSLALMLYAASLRARRRGSARRGALLSAAGASVLGVAAYLGGHLSFNQGVGPDQTVFDPGSTEWHPAADASQLPQGRPTRVVVGDTPILLLRNGDQTFAIHDRCSHRGCSLSEGEIDNHHVVCGCHGSRFDLRDGALLQGPASSPQPAFQVRERDGLLEVRRPSPGSE